MDLVGTSTSGINRAVEEVPFRVVIFSVYWIYFQEITLETKDI